MAWRNINKNGLEGWKLIKQNDKYQTFYFQDNPGEEVQIYQFHYVEQNDIGSYRFRQNNIHAFVPQVLDIFGSKEIKNKKVKVILESTWFRLHEMKKLPNRPILEIVAEVLIGFQALFKQFGTFKIESNMIGFNKKGITKVWINNNFANNQINRFDLQITEKQKFMVKNILDIFDSFGYPVGNNLTNFQQSKKAVINKIMNKNISAALNSISQSTLKVSQSQQSQLISQKKKHKPSMEVISQLTKPWQQQSVLSKTPKNHQNYTEIKKQIESKNYSNQKISINNEQIPTFVDQMNVKAYLGSSLNMVNSKLLFITFLRENKISDSVKDLINVFQYALEKDPDLYSKLLQAKGQIEKGASLSLKAKIKKVKQIYEGLVSSESKTNSSSYSTPTRYLPKDQNLSNSTHSNIMKRKISCNTIDDFTSTSITQNKQQQDMISSFDKALQLFVQQKQKRPFQQSPQKPNPPSQYKPLIPIDKRTTSTSEKWQKSIDLDETIRQKVMLKRQHFAQLKQEASKILGLF